jgi:hypothetical protein
MLLAPPMADGGIQDCAPDKAHVALRLDVADVLPKELEDVTRRRRICQTR